MLQKSLFISTVLTAILSFGFSQGIKALEPETGSDQPESSSTELLSDKADARQRPSRRSRSVLPPLSEFELEEVVVTGRRVEGSGNRRRTAAGRQELDNTDQTDMDSFFDDIDGLSTLGGDDQGNAFSLDGLSPDLSNVTLNGQGMGQGRGNGGFGAGNLPPEMIRRVDIYRTPTASLEEGGAGGSVNLQLRNPVDIVSPSTSIKARLSYVPAKDNFNPSASFFTGQPSETKKFGYMLSVSLSEVTNEYSSQDIPNWLLHDYEGISVHIPSQVRNSAVTDTQRNIFTGLTLGFRPHRSLDISANLFLSQRQKDILNHSLQHRIEKQRSISILAFDGRVATELESSDRNRKNLRIVGSTRGDQTDSLVLGANLVWRRARWRVDGALGYNTDKNKSDPASQSVVFEANSAFAYLADNDGSLSMSYADGFPSTQDFAASRISLSDRNTEDTNQFAGIDVSRPLGGGFIRRIGFGGKFRKMARSRHTSTGRINLDENLALTDFFSGQYQQTPWDTDEWPGSDMDLVNSFVQDSQLDWRKNPLNSYEIERQSGAGYLQADFRTNETRKRFLVGNIGVRLVDTETWIAGFQKIDEAIEAISVITSYTDVLPSFSMRMRVAERTALTLGAAKVMTNPSFNDLAPGVRLNYSDKTARSGNPYLEPFRASQLLAELTWVPVRGRRLSGLITYRDVDSYFALGEETIEFDDNTFLVTRPINGENGYILTAGVKLEQNLRRLTEYLQNFTLFISYTHNKSSTDMRDPYTGEKLPMPKTAEHFVKTDLAYSKNRLSGKLSYQWRGKSLKSSLSKSGLSVWNQPVGSLNLNLGWRLNQKIQLNLDARNLLNEEQVQTTDKITQMWRISERDRSIAATLRAKW